MEPTTQHATFALLGLFPSKSHKNTTFISVSVVSFILLARSVFPFPLVSPNLMFLTQDPQRSRPLQLILRWSPTALNPDFLIYTILASQFTHFILVPWTYKFLRERIMAKTWESTQSCTTWNTEEELKSFYCYLINRTKSWTPNNLPVLLVTTQPFLIEIISMPFKKLTFSFSYTENTHGCQGNKIL